MLIAMPKTRDDLLKAAAKHWTAVSDRTGTRRTRWWQHPRVVRHINRLICGREVDGVAGGDLALLQDSLPGHTFQNAVSVGCGNGSKELSLVKAGLVGYFDLYEISQRRVREGRERTRRMDLSDRVRWHQAPLVFEADHVSATYDLVYWNNALHHMLDVDAAVRWSRHVLMAGGVFYMNDFVGPDRMQWSPEMLDIATRVRAALPERLLRAPDGPRQLPTTLCRPDPSVMAQNDPTECAQSSRIMPAITETFPTATVKLLGGTIYHLALNDVLANMTEEDAVLLDVLLLLDEICAAAGHTHYAIAFAPLKS